MTDVPPEICLKRRGKLLRSIFGERFRPPDYKIRERVSTAKERQARSGRQ